MTDIFQHWKDNRFIIARDDLVNREKVVILTDIKFWVDNIDALNQWCRNRNATVSGMAVTFGDERTLLEFVLRWS